MTGRIGQITGNELWMRCPECGDSPNDPTKCHYAVNLVKWVYHCYRCDAGGKLTTAEILQLADLYSLSVYSTYYDEDDEYDRELPTPLPGAGSARYSALPRGHIPDPNGRFTWDAFQMYTPTGELVGIHLRTELHRLSLGHRGFATPRTLFISSSTDPFVLVEGPYDVLDQSGLTCFGLITEGVLKKLVGHHVILCPDGDIWTKPDLLARFTVLLKRLYERQSGYPVVPGILLLPNGADPDEAMMSAEFVSRNRWPDLFRVMKGVN